MPCAGCSGGSQCSSHVMAASVAAIAALLRAGAPPVDAGTSTPRRLTDDPEAVAPSCAGFGAVPGYTCYTATCAGPPNPTGACGLPILQPAAGHPLPTAQQCTAKDDRAACVRALAAACNGTASCESFSAEQDGSVRLFAGAGITANSGWTTVRLPPLVACEEGSCI